MASSPGPGQRSLSTAGGATCDDWIKVVQPHLPDALIDHEALVRVRACARRLPGDCAGILEIRLAPLARAVDLSIRLTEPDQALRLVDLGSLPHLQAFLTLWARDRFAGRAPYAWLEVDLDRGLSPVLSPVPCVKLRDREEPSWLVETLLPALHGQPLSAAQRRLVERCCGELPASARVLYAFSLLPRGLDAVRLELFGLEPAGMIAYLERVAPRAVPHTAEVAPLFEGVERLHLSFDVGAEVSPRIGIEGSFPRLPHREPRWGELFDRLAARGLCSAGKREAVLAWPGSDSFWTAPERWPVDAGVVGGFCIRLLSHVKVVCRPDEPPEAKAYLLFGFHDAARDGRGRGTRREAR